VLVFSRCVRSDTMARSFEHAIIRINAGILAPSFNNLM
jgi:hypothetical protein